MTETAPNRLQPKDELELREALDLLVPAPRVSDRRDWQRVAAEAHREKASARLHAFISRRVFGGREVHVGRKRLVVAFAVLTAILLPTLAIAGLSAVWHTNDPMRDWVNELGDFDSGSPPANMDPNWRHPFPPQLKDSDWPWVKEFIKNGSIMWYPWGNASPDYPVDEIASGSHDGVEWRTFVYASKARGVCSQTVRSDADVPGSAGCLPVVGVPAPGYDRTPMWFDTLSWLWFEPTEAGGQTLQIQGGPVAKEVSSISIHFPSGQEIEATITPLPAEIGLNASWWTATFPEPEEVVLTEAQIETITDTRSKAYQDWLARRRQFIYTARSADGTVLESINDLGEVTAYQPPSESVTAPKG